MRLKIIIILLFFLIFNGCIYERVRTFYLFEFINTTKDTLYISYECYGSPIVNDTIYPDHKIRIGTADDGSYKNYGDRLILHWFKTISIKTKSKNISKDIFNSKNWEWPEGSQENRPPKHKIEFIFTFQIFESDL